MNSAHDIAKVIVRELEGFEREVMLFPDDESVWQTMPGLTNTAGNLALHVAGNLHVTRGACKPNVGQARIKSAGPVGMNKLA